MARVLEIEFACDNGKTMILHVQKPKPDLTKTQVKAVAEEIIAADIFEGKHGAKIIRASKIQIRQTEVAELA